MTKASVRDFRYDFKKIERLLRQGEEIQITNRRHVVARLIPERAASEIEMPNFLERLRSVYGDEVLSSTGPEIIAQDRSRY